MCWECRERFPRHRLQRKPLVSDPGKHHGTCVTHVPCCMSGSSLIRNGGEDVLAISRRMCNLQWQLRCIIILDLKPCGKFTYLASGPWGLRALSGKCAWGMATNQALWSILIAIEDCTLITCCFRFVLFFHLTVIFGSVNRDRFVCSRHDWDHLYTSKVAYWIMICSDHLQYIRVFVHLCFSFRFYYFITNWLYIF